MSLLSLPGGTGRRAWSLEGKQLRKDRSPLVPLDICGGRRRARGPLDVALRGFLGGKRAGCSLPAGRPGVGPVVGGSRGQQLQAVCCPRRRRRRPPPMPPSWRDIVGPAACPPWAERAAEKASGGASSLPGRPRWWAAAEAAAFKASLDAGMRGALPFLSPPGWRKFMGNAAPPPPPSLLAMIQAEEALDRREVVEVGKCGFSSAAQPARCKAGCRSGCLAFRRMAEEETCPPPQVLDAHLG